MARKGSLLVVATLLIFFTLNPNCGRSEQIDKQFEDEELSNEYLKSKEHWLEEDFKNLRTLSKRTDEGEPDYFCERPEPPQFGHIKGNDYAAGSTVYVYCDKGYYLQGPSPMTCVYIPDPFNKGVMWDPPTQRLCVPNDYTPSKTNTETKTMYWNSEKMHLNPEENPLINTEDLSSEDEIIENEEEEFVPGHSVETTEEQKEIGPPMQHETPSGHIEPEEKSVTEASIMPELCTLPKKVGQCRASMPRYFFNTDTEQCEPFLYGGCKGNDNNFTTKEKCVAVCHQ